MNATRSACGGVDGGEGAEVWRTMLTEIEKRGVEDDCVIVCDGLLGLSESFGVTWQYATA